MHIHVHGGAYLDKLYDVHVHLYSNKIHLICNKAIHELKKKTSRKNWFVGQLDINLSLFWPPKRLECIGTCDD